jgi:hypothetical protein
MKKTLSKLGLAVTIAVQVLFAQETGQPNTEPEAAPPPALATALPKLSVAQTLSGSSLPKGCVSDFTSILEKDGFSMANFMKELPLDVAKVKLQLKSPFGKPKDSEKTNVGLTVGCIKSLPESPAEIASLLKGISLKMGLDLALDAAENFADNSIPANVSKESGSGGGWLKPTISISLAAAGLFFIINGVMDDGDVARNVADNAYSRARDAAESRNMNYGIGAALLAGGLIVYLVF